LSGGISNRYSANGIPEWFDFPSRHLAAAHVNLKLADLKKMYHLQTCEISGGDPDGRLIFVLNERFLMLIGDFKRVESQPSVTNCELTAD